MASGRTLISSRSSGPFSRQVDLIEYAWLTSAEVQGAWTRLRHAVLSKSSVTVGGAHALLDPVVADAALNIFWMPFVEYTLEQSLKYGEVYYTLEPVCLPNSKGREAITLVPVVDSTFDEMQRLQPKSRKRKYSKGRDSDQGTTGVVVLANRQEILGLFRSTGTGIAQAFQEHSLFIDAAVKTAHLNATPYAFLETNPDIGGDDSVHRAVFKSRIQPRGIRSSLAEPGMGGSGGMTGSGLGMSLDDRTESAEAIADSQAAVAQLNRLHQAVISANVKKRQPVNLTGATPRAVSARLAEVRSNQITVPIGQSVKFPPHRHAMLDMTRIYDGLAKRMLFLFGVEEGLVPCIDLHIDAINTVLRQVSYQAYKHLGKKRSDPLPFILFEKGPCITLLDAGPPKPPTPSS